MTVGVKLQGIGQSWAVPVRQVPRASGADNTNAVSQQAQRYGGAPENPILKTYRADGRGRMSITLNVSAGESLARGAQALQNRAVEDSGKTGIEKEAECTTCAQRRYQDGSDDMGVSFQSPTHVSPEASVAAVTAHEQEHVVREGQDAEEKGMNAISHVRVHMAKCPECGKMYAAGGVTETTKLPEKEKDTYLEGVGVNFDQAV